MLEAVRLKAAIRDGIDPFPGLFRTRGVSRVRYHRLPRAPRSYLRRKWRRDFIGRLPHGGAWARRTPYGIALRDAYYTPVWSGLEGGTVVAPDEDRRP